MNFQITKSLSNDEIIAKLTDHDFQRRLPAAVFDTIVTRLADAFVQKYGEDLVNTLLHDEKLKDDITAIIKQRLAEETVKAHEKRT